MSILPTTPHVLVESQPTPSIIAPFLVLDHRHVAIEVDGRRASATYSAVTRQAIDAVVIVAYYMRLEEPWVYLRSCVRPPLAFRGAHAVLWELPAGLVETDESPLIAGARELHEEIGFVVSQTDLIPLGPAVAPAAGLIAEMQTFFRAEVDPTMRTMPAEDGSPFELGGVVIDVPLVRALQACAAGEIIDGKTELGLRRLAEVLAQPEPSAPRRP